MLLSITKAYSGIIDELRNRPFFESRNCPLPHSTERKIHRQNYRGARLTTRRTIASTTPANIKISSPISKTILSRNQTHFAKNLSHLGLNGLSPSILKQTVSRVLKRSEYVRSSS